MTSVIVTEGRRRVKAPSVCARVHVKIVSCYSRKGNSNSRALATSWKLPNHEKESGHFDVGLKLNARSWLGMFVWMGGPWSCVIQMVPTAGHSVQMKIFDHRVILCPRVALG